MTSPDRVKELVTSAHLWTRRSREATGRKEAELADRERRNAFRALYHYIYDNSRLTSAEAFKRASTLLSSRWRISCSYGHHHIVRSMLKPQSHLLSGKPRSLRQNGLG